MRLEYKIVEDVMVYLGVVFYVIMFVMFGGFGEFVMMIECFFVIIK